MYIPAAVQHTDGLECEHPYATGDHCGKPDHQDLPCAGVIKITFSNQQQARPICRYSRPNPHMTELRCFFIAGSLVTLLHLQATKETSVMNDHNIGIRVWVRG
jgi:hypothetical protein